MTNEDLPAWAKDPDAELARQARAEQALDHQATGCAVLVRGFFVCLFIIGVIGGLLYVVR